MKAKAAAVLVLLLALIPSAYLAWSWRDMPHLGIYHDDSIYWVTAKSLGEGRGYRIESLPGEPVQTKYPPVYPMLLSMVWRLAPDFPANLNAAMLLGWSLLPVYLLVVARLFGGYGFSLKRSCLLCALLAVNPVVVLFSASLMSELLFAVLLAATIILAEKASRKGATAWLAVAAGLLAGATYLTRSAALPLAITAPLCFLPRRQWRQAAFFACAMAPAVAGWQLWTHAHVPASKDMVTLYYTNYFGYHLANVSWQDLPKLVWTNADHIISGIGKLIVFSDGAGWGYIMLARLVAVGALLGAVRLAKRTGAWQFPAFAAGYLALLAQWHYPPDARFVMPLVPVVLAGFVTEIEHLAGLIRLNFTRPKRADRAAAALAGAGVAAFLGFAAYMAWYGLASFLPAVFEQNRRLLEENRHAYQWIARNSAGDSQFFAYSDPLLYLYTGRKACSIRVPPILVYRSDRSGIEGFITSLPAFARQFDLDYALFTRSDFHLDAMDAGLAAVKRLLKHEPSFRLRYQNGGAAVYRLQRQ